MVTECKAISNCDPNRTDHWFNSCSKCLNTHAWSYSSGAINFDNCVTRNIDNCEVVDNTGANQICKYCAKGYDLVYNRCEKNLVAKCGSQYNNELILTESFWFAAKKQSILGCDSCVVDNTANYVLVKSPIGTQ